MISSAKATTLPMSVSNSTVERREKGGEHGRGGRACPPFSVAIVETLDKVQRTVRANREVYETMGP